MIKRKKLEGFTLVEIIIALAVFAIMSLVVVMIIQMANAIIRDSQNTSQKANTHTILSEMARNEYKVAGSSSSYDAIDDSVSITFEGVTLDQVRLVTLEGSGTYDSSAPNREASPEGNFYEEAPNLKVFCAEPT